MAEALKTVRGIFNTIGCESFRYGPSPLLPIIRTILEFDSFKGPQPCPYCTLPWDTACPHVIYTFVGPTYMER